MSQDIDRKAAKELKAMASMYLNRGNTEKAAELMHLSEQIQRRLDKDNVFQMSDWHDEEEQKEA